MILSGKETRQNLKIELFIRLLLLKNLVLPN